MLLRLCDPFTSPTDDTTALTLANTLAQYNGGELAGGPPSCGYDEYYKDSCPCRCAGANSTVSVDYFLEKGGSRVYTIVLPDDGNPSTSPLVTITSVVGTVTAYVTDNRGYNLVPSTGYFAPVSTSGVIHVTVFGNEAADYGTIKVQDQLLPAGVTRQLAGRDTDNVYGDSGSDGKGSMLGVYIGIPVAVVVLVAILVAVFVFKDSIMAFFKGNPHQITVTFNSNTTQ